MSTGASLQLSFEIPINYGSFCHLSKHHQRPGVQLQRISFINSLKNERKDGVRGAKSKDPIFGFVLRRCKVLG